MRAGSAETIDEILCMRVEERVVGERNGASLACEGTYRRAASIEQAGSHPVSPGTIQRMAWQTGNDRSGESAKGTGLWGGTKPGSGKVVARSVWRNDGVWLHLQREGKRSVEARVGILSSGKKRVGKDRFRLENKCCVTEIVDNAQEWQETLLKAAYQTYDLEKTRLLVTGGDGNRWVRQSFQRFGIQEEFVLDRFHLERAARHVLGRNKETRHLLREMYEKGVGAIEKDLAQRIAHTEGGKQKELIQFYHYLQNNQEGLIDLKYRHCPGGDHAHTLGAIEGNVDKLVVHRMKGRGCSWRLDGAQAMLALCRHKEELKDHVYRYIPIHSSIPGSRVQSHLSTRIHPAGVPLFRGPDQGKPWVKQLRRSLYGTNSLF